MVAIVSGSGVGLLNTSAGTLGQNGLFGNANFGSSSEAAYVNIATGNLSLQAQDEYLASKGISLALGRTYNSQGVLNIGNGLNWQFGVNKQVTGLTGSVNTVGSTVTRLNGDGSASLYTFNAARNAYVTTDGGGAYQTITFDSRAHQWVWRSDHNDLKGPYEQYDFTIGFLTHSTDQLGQRLKYFYNGNRQISTITDASGDQMHFDYAAGNVASVRVVPAGGTTQSRVSYTYDPQNRLRTVTVDLTPENTSDTRTYITTYIYDGLSSRVASVTQGDGTNLSFTYEAAGQYRVTSFTDGVGRTTSFDYAQADKTTVIDHLGARTTYAYDGKRQLLSITEPNVGSESQITRFEYDLSGNVSRAIDARGLATDFGYDSNGNRILERDASGKTITRVYSAANRLLSETRFTAVDPDGGGPAQPTGKMTTRYVYDVNNRLSFTIDAEAKVQSFEYNAQGQMYIQLTYLDATLAETGSESVYTFDAMQQWMSSGAARNGNASRVEFAYDARGLMSKRTTFAPTLYSAFGGTVDAAMEVVQFVYDQAGQLLQTIDGKNGTSVFTYDGLGRRLSARDALGNYELYSYDDVANRRTTTSANGVTSTSIYDQAGQLVGQVRSDAGGTLVGQTTYAYDGAGRLRMQTDPNGMRSFVLYDEAGRKSATVSAAGSLTEFQYDANDQLIKSIVYATKVSSATLLDVDGKPKALTLDQAGLRPQANGSDRTEWRLYDNANRLAKLIDGLGLVTDHTYDGASRLVAVVRRAAAIDLALFAANPTAANASPSAGEGDRVTRNAYDNNGRLRFTLDSEGYLTELRYNGGGQQVKTIRYSLPATAQVQASSDWHLAPIATSSTDIVTTASYDGLGRLISDTDGAGNVTGRKYDGAGNLLSTTRGNVLIRYEYDAKGQRIAQYLGAAATSSTRYTYDAQGNQTSVTDALGGKTQFIYDPNNRLRFTIDPLGTVSENRYDPNGNLFAKVIYGTPINPATTPPLSVLTQAEVQARIAPSASFDTNEIWRYDADGRVIWHVDGTGATTEFKFDATGNLLKRIQYKLAQVHTRIATLAATPTALPPVPSPVADTTSYFYNAVGKLVFTIDPIGAVEELRYDAIGNIVETIEYAIAVTPPEAEGATVAMARERLQASATDVHAFMRYDQLGRVIWSVNSIGAATQYGYDAQGNLVARVTYSEALTANALAQLAASLDAVPAPVGAYTVTSFVYDGAGRQIFSIDTLAIVNENRYDANGNIVEVVRHSTPLAQLVNRTSDASANQLSVGTVRQMLAGSSGARQLNRYDNFGRLIWSVDPVGTATNRSYDFNGNVTSETLYGTPLGSAELARLVSDPIALPQFSSGVARATTHYAYDGDNRLVFSIDPNGGVTETRYDAKDRVSGTTRYVHPVVVSNSNLGGTLTPSSVRDLLQPDAARDLRQFQRYDKNGKLTWMVDGAGIATKFTYDSRGNLVSRGVYTQALSAASFATFVADSRLGAPTPPSQEYFSETRYHYDAGGRLSFTSDPSGVVSETIYDVKGNVVHVVRYAAQSFTTYAVGTSAESIRRQVQLEIRDTSLDTHELRRYDISGRLTWTVDAEGAATEMRYDALGNLTSRTAYATALSDAAVQALIASPDLLPVPVDHGSVSRFVYDQQNRLVFSVDALGVVSENRYDGNSQIVETVRYAAAIDPAMGDSANHVRSALQVNAASDVHTFLRYDMNGRVIWSVDAAGAATQLRYDSSGNLTVRTEWVQPLGALALAALSAEAGSIPVTSGASRVTKYVYDQNDRQIFTVDAAGNVQENRYDAIGNVIETIRYANPIALSAQGSGALDISTVRNQLVLNAAGDAHTIQRYDLSGRVSWSVDGTGAATQFAYDAFGNIVQRTEYSTPLSAEALLDLIARPEAVPSPVGPSRVQRSFYGQDQRLTYVIDALGFVTEYRYDRDGRVVETLHYTEAPSLSAPVTIASIGNATAILDAIRDFKRYDATGRLSWTADAMGAVSTFTYDTRGNLTSRVKYDVALTAAQIAGLSGAASAAPIPAGAISRVSYTYDAVNRPVHTIDAAGAVTENRYDTAGNVVETVRYAKLVDTAQLAFADLIDVQNLLQPSSADIHARYRYDKSKRLTWSIDPLGAVTERVYDGLGNVARTVRYAAALQGSLEQGAVPQVVATPATDGAWVVKHALDRVTSYEYDAIGRTTVQTDGVGTADASTQSWAYDSAGNVTRHTDGRGNVSWSAYDRRNQLVRHIDALGYVTTRKYYADGQIKSETRYSTKVGMPSPPNDTWAYDSRTDPVANIDPVKGDQTRSWTYNDAGRVLTETDAMGGMLRHLYDGLGNRTDTTVAYGNAAAVTRHWTYDRASRVLTETEAFGTADARTTVFGYDTWGNQTSITSGGRTTVQRFDAVGRKTSVQSAAMGTTTTTYNTFGDIVKVLDARGGVGYFYADALGRVTLQIDPEGALSETRYDLQGNTTHSIRYANKVTGVYDETTVPKVVSEAGSGVHVVRSPKDQSQEVRYDALGRKTSVLTAYEGNAVYTDSFTYDRNGNLETMTARNSAVTVYEYDKNNRLLRETLPVTSKDALGNQILVTNAREYDARGNVVMTTEALGLPEQRITVYEFDKLDRQVKEIGESIVTFDPASQSDIAITPVKQRVFDVRGNVIEEIDARGGRTVHYFDLGNREVAMVDPAGTYTRYTYDAAGMRDSQVVYANPVVAYGSAVLASGVVPSLLAANAPVPASGVSVRLDPANDRRTAYTYDGAGRLTSTVIDAIRTATFDPVLKSYVLMPTEIRTDSVYDLAGNVVKTTDGNRNVTRNYYNKAGQLTAQLDAMRYLTVYTRDAFGNLESQVSHAKAVATSVVVDDSTTQAQLIVEVSADDRITHFAYDRMGRTLSESRLNVAYATLSDTGALQEVLGAATTAYEYDGLSNVTRRTDANGAVTDSAFDGLGRKTRELLAAFVDYRGVSVRKTTDYVYDGLDHLKQQLVRGDDNASEADDRITSYQYGTGGHLIGQTDPGLAQLAYRIDAAGNITKKTLVGRINADGAGVNDVTLYWYDANGREVRHTDASTGTVAETRYNQFGEITGKRTNPAPGSTEWSEFSDYDQAGRAWRSNAGDGITKVFGYDRNGNATLKLDSASVDLRDSVSKRWTLTEIKSLPDVNQFFSTYDARNQLNATYQPAMRGGHNMITVVESLTQKHGTSFGGVGNDVSMGVAAGLGGNAVAKLPSVPGTASIERGQSVTVTLTDEYWASTSRYSKTKFTKADHMLSLNVPDTSALGDGRVRIDISLPATGDLMGYQGPLYVPAGSSTANLAFSELIDGDTPGYPVGARTFTYTIYKETNHGPVNLGTHTWYRTAPANGTSTASKTSVISGNSVQFEQRHDTTRLVLMTRTGAGGWAVHNVPQAMFNNVAVPGKFTFDWSALPRDSYDFRYVGFDANNNVTDSEQGIMVLSDTSPTMSQTPHTMGGAGRAFVNAAGAFVFNELGGDAASLVVSFRAAGSQAAWQSRTLTPALVGGTALPGWFEFSPDGLSGGFEFQIEAKNVAGATVNKSSSTFTVGPPNSINEPAGVSVQTLPTANIGVEAISPQTLGVVFYRTTTINKSMFGGEPIETASAPSNSLVLAIPDTSAMGGGDLRVAVTLSGSSDGFGSYSGFNGSFDVAYGLTSKELRLIETATGSGGNDGVTYTYTIYKKVGNTEVKLAERTATSNPSKTEVNTSTVRISRSRTESVIQTGETMVGFAVSGGPLAARLLLQYRKAGDLGGWSVMDVPKQLGDGSNRFAFNWVNQGLAPADYDYHALAVDAAGNVLNSSGGIFRLQTSSSITPNAPSLIGGAGRVFMDTNGNLNFVDQGTATATLSIRYRPQGSSELWSTRTVLQPAHIGAVATPGWFVYQPTGSGALEYVVEARGADGQLIGKTAGTFVTGTTNGRTVSELSGYSEPPVVTYFHSQPATAATMQLSYRPTGSGAYTQVMLSKAGPGIFEWSSGSVFSSDTSSAHFDFIYETKDSNGILVNKAHGVVSLGAVSALVSRASDAVPTLLSFKAPVGNAVAATATTMVLEYRLSGQGDYRSATMAPDANGVFVLDASALIAPGGTGTIEYSYTLFSGATKLLREDKTPIEVKGIVNVGATEGPAGHLWLEGAAISNVKLIERHQTTNAFGEVDSETNARSHTTQLRYNTLGNMVSKEDPSVMVTLSNGFAYAMSPRTSYYFDRAGRTLATRDANGNLTSQLWSGAGSYMATEFHADGGTKANRYDLFGDLRYSVDELGQQTDYSYDKNGRLVLIQRPVRGDLTRSEVQLTYDQAGNRLTQAERATVTDSFASFTGKTWYDSMGRVVKVMTSAGRASSTSYVWDGAIKSTGGRVTGGWRQTTTDPMGRTMIDDIDAYGRVTAHKDLGEHTFVYSFNYAGWLDGQTGSSGQNISYTYYANGYVQSIRDIALGTESSYEYDEVGNRTYEAYRKTLGGKTEYLESASVTYDALNRVTRIDDVRADIYYEYDAVGNRRRVRSEYSDGADGARTSQDLWYDYDSMNRFTVTMGKLSSVNGAVGLSATDTSVRVVLGNAGGEGVQVWYNKAGQRISAVYARDGHREDYTYGKEGYLEDTHINADASAKGSLVSKRVNDMLGRTTNYYEYNAQGGIDYERATEYTTDGRQKKQIGTDGTVNYYYYNQRNEDGRDSFLGASDTGVGELAFVQTVTETASVSTFSTYEYWDDAKQLAQRINGVTSYRPATGWRAGFSAFTYNVNGHLVSATDVGADSTIDTADDTTFHYISNAQGLILRREQNKGITLGMVHRYIYLNGAMVGDVGNDGDANLDYAQTLSKNQASREEMYKSWRPVSSADFDQNYQAITRSYPAPNGSSYTVKAGDSLYAIAGALWGDVSMWYLIADANGITAETVLTPGLTLTIPNKVTNIHNNSSTTRPYDAGKIIGDTSPTLPDAPLPAPPPTAAGCGALGMIIMVVIAVVVSIYAGPAIGNALYTTFVGPLAAGATAATTAGVGALVASTAGSIAGAALGSIASQSAGVMMGMQDKINWRAVRSSGLSAGIMPYASPVSSSLGGFATVANAAISNVVAQGIAKATGEQEHFSWRSVAAAAIAAPVMSGIRKEIGDTSWAKADADLGRLAGVAGSVVVSSTFGMAIAGGRLSWSAIAANVASSYISETVAYNSPGAVAERRAADQMRAGIEDREAADWAWNKEHSNEGEKIGAPRRNAYAFDERSESVGNGDGIASDDANYDGGVSNEDIWFSKSRGSGVRRFGGRVGLSDPESDVNGVVVAKGNASPESIYGKHDLTNQANFGKYLNEVSRQNAAGATLSAQDIATSKALLFYYQGYAMGESDASSKNSGTTTEQLAGALNDTYSPALGRALTAFSGSAAAEQTGRYDFYSGITQVGSGRGRSVTLTHDGREVKIDWSATFSDFASSVGVGPDEALRKTDYAVYKKVIDAAFATDTVRGITIEGAWRPSADDYKEIKKVKAPYSATSLHISSRALDISIIDYVDGERAKQYSVNNGGYDFNAKTKAFVPKTAASEMFNDFRENLGGGWRELYDPWKMQKGIKTWDNSPVVLNKSDLDYLHFNHLHLSLKK